MPSKATLQAQITQLQAQNRMLLSDVTFARDALNKAMGTENATMVGALTLALERLADNKPSPLTFDQRQLLTRFARARAREVARRADAVNAVSDDDAEIAELDYYDAQAESRKVASRLAAELMRSHGA